MVTPGTCSLADFTSENILLPQLQSRDMADAIRELTVALGADNPSWDAAMLNRLAFEREQQMSTAVEFGAAFPHVRLGVDAAFPEIQDTACKKLQFALGRSAKPLNWPGGSKVRFVFLNVVPAGDSSGYLKLVSAMAKLGRDRKLLEDLQNAPTAAEMLQVLAKIPVKN